MVIDVIVRVNISVEKSVKTENLSFTQLFLY